MRTQTLPRPSIFIITRCIGVASIVVLGCNARLAISDETVSADAGGGDVLVPERPVDSCGCVSSPELMALGCDVPGDVALPSEMNPLVTPDGSAAAFVHCDHPVGDPGQVTCDTFHWTLSGESVRHRGIAALDMSDDGATLLVRDEHSDGRFQLLRAGGALVPLPEHIQSARLTRDGASVIGASNEGGGTRLVRWTEATGVAILSELDGSGVISDTTPDGSTVIGWTSSTAPGLDQPFRWTAREGFSVLGDLSVNASGARPRVVSADGSTIAGFTVTALENVETFRWQAGATTTLIPTGAIDTNLRLSANGAVLAGTLVGDGFPGAYRLSLEDTWEGSIVLDPEALSSTLVDMTPDGRVIVGDSASGGFLWTWLPGESEREDPDVPGPSNHGALLKFGPALAASGVVLTGWEVRAPAAVSDDGRVVFGHAMCGSVPTLYRWVVPN